LRDREFRLCRAAADSFLLDGKVSEWGIARHVDLINRPAWRESGKLQHGAECGETVVLYLCLGTIGAVGPVVQDGAPGGRK
jgi:hypothetical protein